MNYTERDEKQNEASTREERDRRPEENSPKHKAPFAPDSSDDSAVGDTDQHSDA
ncbi:MAG TPA: hypothetical protein VFN55_15455 [Solirubrobacteraceae bacterium]|nr:hypothetical protein [Solirubrobacteraceae bacterium]